MFGTFLIPWKLRHTHEMLQCYNCCRGALRRCSLVHGVKVPSAAVVSTPRVDASFIGERQAALKGPASFAHCREQATWRHTLSRSMQEALLDEREQQEPATSTRALASPPATGHDDEPPFSLRNEARYFLHKGIPLVGCRTATHTVAEFASLDLHMASLAGTLVRARSRSAAGLQHADGGSHTTERRSAGRARLRTCLLQLHVPE